MRQIILDTETTGLSPEEGHRVIEIGCLELINRRLTGEYRHYYLNPERSIERAAEEVHGLTAEFLQDKPKFAEIAEPFLDFIRDAELVIHNAPFDVGFLNHEFNLWKRHHLPVSHYCKILDTLVLAKRKHPGQKNSLDALCRRYHVDNSSRQYHGALLDAELLAQVYLFMTGGQTQLFSEEIVELTAASANLSLEKLSTQQAIARMSLPLIEASEAELAAHQEFMNQYVK